jgi:hypothetical protein
MGRATTTCPQCRDPFSAVVVNRDLMQVLEATRSREDAIERQLRETIGECRWRSLAVFFFNFHRSMETRAELKD